MLSHQAVWDAKYDKLKQGEINLSGDPWLENWLHLVPGDGPRRALDIGCGSGLNTRLLLDRDFQVTGIDFSEQALELCRNTAHNARLQKADVRGGIPFSGERFELIVADQSLHYFSMEMTVNIIEDVADRLVPGGLFAGRFNSTSNEGFRAGKGEPVLKENNLVNVGGLQKRYFTRECFSKLFGSQWTEVCVAEKVISRFGAGKVLWEAVATKSD